MAKNTYIGVNNVSRKVKKMYIGVNGVARKVKKGYIGVNGVARQFYSSRLGYTAFYGTGSNIYSNSGGTIGDYAIFYDQSSSSTGFTAVSNSLTVTTIGTASGYTMKTYSKEVHNNQLVSVVGNSSRIPQLRGINSSLTQQFYTSLSLPYRTRDFYDQTLVEFNNNLYYLYAYDEDEDGYTNRPSKISSSMTISSLTLAAATNSTYPRGYVPELYTLIGSIATNLYLHLMDQCYFPAIYSLNSSDTAFLSTYNTTSSSGDSYGFSSLGLKANFDGKAIFGWGGMKSTNTATSSINTSGVSIDDNLTLMYYNTIINGLTPGYAFNTVFDNVLWVGCSKTSPNADNYSVIYKLKSGLTQEMDNTYTTTYQNATGISYANMTAAVPTSANDPSFLVCPIYKSYGGGVQPAMIYQR